MEMANLQCEIKTERDLSLACWRRFLRCIAFRVEECNTIAGEVLWVMRTGQYEDFQLTVQSSSNPGDRVTCCFNPETGVLTCTPGPDNSGEMCRFVWAGEVFRHGASPLSHDLTACAVLDKLVFAGEN